MTASPSGASQLGTRMSIAFAVRTSAPAPRLRMTTASTVRPCCSRRNLKSRSCREGTEPVGPLLPDAAVSPGQVRRRGSRPRGKRKDMDRGQRRGFEEVFEAPKIGFALAGEADEDVGPEGRRGRALPKAIEDAEVAFARAGSAHGLEDLFGRMLEREMEMRTDRPRSGDMIDDLRPDEARIEGAQTDAEASRRIFDLPEKLEKRAFPLKVAAVGGKMDSRENGLPESPGRELGQPPPDDVGRNAPALPPDRGDDAKRARHVAAVLDFEKGARRNER